MDPQTLVLFVAKATLLLAVGAAIAALQRRAPAGDRHLVWLFTLAGLLVLPGLLYVAPLRLAILPQDPVTGSPARPAAATSEAPAVVLVAPASAGALRTTAVARPLAPGPRAASPVIGALPAASSLLVGLWLGGAVLLLGWLAGGALTVRRIVRSARPLEGARWRTVLCEVADRLGVAELPRLVASPRVEVPFACGIARATIVLPDSADQWTDERLRLVLVHEIAHVRRHDLVAHAVGRLACALYWFHPLVWAAARRLRAESERACDDLVLTCGARASDYAGLLLDVVTAARRHGAPATAVPMARRRELEGRVLAILDPAMRREPPRRVQSGALLGSLGVLVVLVAAAAPSVPAQTPEPAPSRPATLSARAGEQERAEAPEPPEAPEPAVARAPRHVRDAATAPAMVPDLAGRRALLAQLLRNDPDAAVRRSAAWALGETGRGQDASALAAALRSDHDAEVREMAAWALAEARSPEASTALAEALHRDAGDEVRATAAWALGQTDHADTGALLAGAADRDADVQQAAIWALGNQRLSQAPAPLTAALRDGNPEVRLVAAWALGEIRDPASAPAVRAAFGAEKNDDCRRALFRTLAMLGVSTADIVDQALASTDPELRERAVMMAAGRGLGVWPWPWPWPQPRPNP